MVSSSRMFLVKCLVALLFVASTTTVVNAQAGSLMPIPAPTLPAGGNPVVTPNPASQGGTLGPTTQVLTQQFGELFTAAPTVIPPTAPSPTTTSSARAPSIGTPPVCSQMASAAVGVAGMAAALL